MDRELRHIKLILSHQRHHLNAAEWRALVQDTKASILNCPQDFLCIEVPSRKLFSAAIEKVFDGFMEDQRLLSMQDHRTFDKFFDSKKTLRRKLASNQAAERTINSPGTQRQHFKPGNPHS